MSRLVIGGANFNQKYGINNTRLHEKDLFEILKSPAEEYNSYDTLLRVDMARCSFWYTVFKV